MWQCLFCFVVKTFVIVRKFSENDFWKIGLENMVLVPCGLVPSQWLLISDQWSLIIDHWLLTIHHWQFTSFINHLKIIPHRGDSSTRRVWGAYPPSRSKSLGCGAPSSHCSSDLSKFIFEQLGALFYLVYGILWYIVYGAWYTVTAFTFLVTSFGAKRYGSLILAPLALRLLHC